MKKAQSFQKRLIVLILLAAGTLTSGCSHQDGISENENAIWQDLPAGTLMFQWHQHNMPHFFSYHLL
jgi:hypothetical protein